MSAMGTWVATEAATEPVPRGISLYCLLAGFCDTSTGVLLLAAPNFTLQLMGITPSTETLFIRFIGVFVGSIGLAYLYPWWAGSFGGSSRERRTTSALFEITALLEITALCRFAVGLFVTVSIFQGALQLPWVSVAITDLTLASVQVWLLRRGFLAPKPLRHDNLAEGARS